MLRLRYTQVTSIVPLILRTLFLSILYLLLFRGFLNIKEIIFGNGLRGSASPGTNLVSHDSNNFLNFYIPLNLIDLLYIFDKTRSNIVSDLC